MRTILGAFFARRMRRREKIESLQCAVSDLATELRAKNARIEQLHASLVAECETGARLRAQLEASEERLKASGIKGAALIAECDKHLADLDRARELQGVVEAAELDARRELDQVRGRCRELEELVGREQRISARNDQLSVEITELRETNRKLQDEQDRAAAEIRVLRARHRTIVATGVDRLISKALENAQPAPTGAEGENG